ncbi:MAG: putative Zn-dependent protease, partial [Flavobacteriales bacterium]
EQYDKAKQLIQSMEILSNGKQSTHKLALNSIGLPACRGFLAFAQGRYADAVKHLMPVRNSGFNFGGSHAQRDIISTTVIEALLRDGQHRLARTLLNERLESKPSSPQNWMMVSRAYSGLGQSGRAQEADQTANRLVGC